MSRSPISPHTLRQVQRIDEAAMPSRADITDNASTRAVVATDVPCRLSAVREPDTDPGGGREIIYQRWNIAFPIGTDVRPEWRITMRPAPENPPHIAGRVFTVRGDAAGSYSTSRTVLCEEGQ